MKRILNLLFAAVALIGVVSSCQKDNTEDYGANSPLGYGTDLTILMPVDFSDTIPLESITCEVRTSTPELLLITATHSVENGRSVFTLDEALPVGDNVLRAVRYTGQSSTRSSDYSEMALGCVVNVSNNKSLTTPSTYNSEYKLFGEGTSAEPFRIASALNFAAINNMDRTDYFFRQIDSVDFFRYYGHEAGFEGVCPEYNKPFNGYFKGDGFEISNLAIRRYSEEQDNADLSGSINPAGLFCCISGAVIEDVTLNNPHIVGDEAVGGVVGVILGASGNSESVSIVNRCKLIRSGTNDNKILGTIGVGGIIGCIEYEGKAVVSQCSVAKELIIEARSAENCGNYLGGIIGASGLYASLSISDCVNNAPLQGDGITCLGGIIGSAQTIKMLNCINNANVTLINGVDDSVGVGGLIGGSTDAIITGSTNNGAILGTRGVGGLVGSSIYDTGADSDMYGSITIMSSHNYGDVYGTKNVGGIVGEGQVCLTTTVNQGTIGIQGVAGTTTGEANIGGLVGFGSFLVARDAHNLGAVNGDYSGGISGIAEYFFLYGCSNIGSVRGNVSVGGLIGKTSEYGLINYSSNFGDIDGSFCDTDPSCEFGVGGLVGTLGQHLTTADKLSALGEDAIEVGIMAAVKLGAEGVFGVGLKKGTGAMCKVVGDIMGHAPILIEFYEIGLAIKEYVELSEELAERCEEVEEKSEEAEDMAEESEEATEGAEEDAEETTDDTDTDTGSAGLYAIYAEDEINALKERFSTGMMDGITANNTVLDNLLATEIASVKYQGAMDLDSDIINPTFNNMRSFCTAIDSDSYEGSTVNTTLLQSSFEHLYGLCLAIEHARKVEEIIAIVEKSIVAAASIICGIGVEKWIKKGASLIKKAGRWFAGTCGVIVSGSAANIGIYAQQEFTDDSDNTIVVNQCCNFGKVTGGSGIIGAIGDRIFIQNILSAGPADIAAIANEADSKDLYDEYMFCIGSDTQKVYSDKSFSSVNYTYTYIYGTSKEFQTMSADEFSDRSSYPEGMWSTGLWSMDDDDDLPMIFNSQYLSFMPN